MGYPTCRPAATAAAAAKHAKAKGRGKGKAKPTTGIVSTQLRDDKQLCADFQMNNVAIMIATAGFISVVRTNGFGEKTGHEEASLISGPCVAKKYKQSYQT